MNYVVCRVIEAQNYIDGCLDPSSHMHDLTGDVSRVFIEHGAVYLATDSRPTLQKKGGNGEALHGEHVKQQVA